MPLSFPFSGRIMLPGTATECLAFSEQKPAPPNAKSFRVNEGGASHRLHQLKNPKKLLPKTANCYQALLPDSSLIASFSVARQRG